MARFFPIARKALQDWWARDPLSQSAAAAYYAVFSLPGLLIIVITIAATMFEQSSVESQALSHIRDVLGSDVANTMHIILQNTHHKVHDAWAMAVGGIALFFGVTGLFVQLQKSLNHVWGIEVNKHVDFLTFFKTRLIALGITISLGFLLLISLCATAALTAFSNWLAEQFSQNLVNFLYGLNFLVSLFIISILFALIYKILPDVHLKWRDSFKGGFVAAILFIMGEYGLSLYFRLAEPQTAFGTAGSFILFLIWVFYSCLVLLYGAEFIRSSIDHAQEERPKPKHLASFFPSKKSEP